MLTCVRTSYASQRYIVQLHYSNIRSRLVTRKSRLSSFLSSGIQLRHSAVSAPCSTAVQTLECIVHFRMRKRATAGGKPQATTCRTSTSLTVALERPVGEGFAESDLHRRPRPVSPAPWHRRRGFLVLRNIGSDLCCQVGSARGRENTHRGVPKKEKVRAGLADPVPMAGRLGSTFQRGGIANTLVNRTSPARGFCTATEGDQTLCQAQKQTSNLNEVLSEDKLSGTVTGLVRQLPSVSAAPIFG